MAILLPDRAFLWMQRFLQEGDEASQQRRVGD